MNDNANNTHVTVKALANGVVIGEQTLRATQVIELDADADMLKALKVKAAAGDIEVVGLPADKPALKSFQPSEKLDK